MSFSTFRSSGVCGDSRGVDRSNWNQRGSGGQDRSHRGQDRTGGGAYGTELLIISTPTPSD